VRRIGTAHIHIAHT